MATEFVCSECKTAYAFFQGAYQCRCGGLFDLEGYDFSFSKAHINNKEWSLFRYLKALPFPDDFDTWMDVTMGEGLTPILPLERKNPKILVKVEYLMPTLSFKDRGAVVLIAHAKSMGVKRVIQDSSGNAGNSIAAYAARAGMDCIIYVAAGTSAVKIQQMQSHGAEVRLVKGVREDAAYAAEKAVADGEGYYASHIYNPFFYQGTKTFAYEIFEQLTGDIPSLLVIPVGNGTLLLGAYYGFLELQTAGLVKRMPKILAVQALNCCPIYQSFQEGLDTVKEGVNKGTVAEGIAIQKPRRGRQILAAIRATGGDMVTAPEDLIPISQHKLAQKGFFVEKTAAAALAGYEYYCQKTGCTPEGRVLIPLSGAGLKSI